MSVLTNRENIYKKKDLIELFNFIESRLEDKDGEYVVAFKTTLHDIDLQPKQGIICYLETLKEMFKPLGDECGIKFQFSITPYDQSLMNLQPEFDNLLKEKNETAKA